MGGEEDAGIRADGGEPKRPAGSEDPGLGRQDSRAGRGGARAPQPRLTMGPYGLAVRRRAVSKGLSYETVRAFRLTLFELILFGPNQPISSYN